MDVTPSPLGFKRYMYVKGLCYAILVSIEKVFPSIELQKIMVWFCY